jgi:hypothetical protein
MAILATERPESHSVTYRKVLLKYSFPIVKENGTAKVVRNKET